MSYSRPEYAEHHVFHIYNRGVAKLPIFINDEDYKDFQDIIRYLLIGFPSQKDANLPRDTNLLPVTYKADPLSNGLFRSLIDLIAHCLMPNHFHLIVQIKQATGSMKRVDGRIASFYSVPEFIRRLCITYGHKFNGRNSREGAVFQGRFKIKHIPDDSSVLQVCRYIHINPVVANLVQKPEEWRFSDYRQYVEANDLERPSFTNTHLLLSYFDGKRQRYKEFVESSISEHEVKVIQRYIIDEDKG